jgi:hypothetical protein
MKFMKMGNAILVNICLLVGLSLGASCSEKTLKQGETDLSFSGNGAWIQIKDAEEMSGNKSTFLKIDSTKQAKDLNLQTGKCPLNAGQKIGLQSPPVLEGNHYRVKLKKPMIGCQFSKDFAFVFKGHVAQVSSSSTAPKSEQKTQTLNSEGNMPEGNLSAGLENYDKETGKLLADRIKTFVAPDGTKCGESGRSLGKCMTCVGWALTEKLGNGREIWPVGQYEELNANTYANSFAKAFNSDKPYYQKALKLQPIKGLVDPSEAPAGTVLVWQTCSGHPAGHIAISVGNGRACSDFCAPINNTCPLGNGGLSGMYMPIR